MLSRPLVLLGVGAVIFVLFGLAFLRPNNNGGLLWPPIVTAGLITAATVIYKHNTKHDPEH